MSSIVLLSGPVGAGKTTVAKALVEASEGPTVYIEGDAFWFFIAKPLRDQGRNQKFHMIMRAMTASARSFARTGYEVILDFSIPPWFLDTARAIAKETPLDFVVLRPSEAVCASRAAARDEGTIPDYAPYRDLYAAFDGAERHMISDDEGDAAVVAARIRQGISAGSFRLG